MKVALRTQQILAEETRVPAVVDPLGGSYYVEALTNEFEAAVLKILADVEALGGTVRAIEEGWFQREIAESAYRTARAKAAGEHVVIGVNKHVEPPEPAAFDIHRVDADVEARQVARLRAVRARRDGARVAALLDRLEHEARDPRERDAAHRRAGPRPRNPWGDRHPPTQYLGHLRGTSRVLTPF